MSILLISPLEDFFISDIMFLIISIHNWLFLWFISFCPNSPPVHACCSSAVLDFATYLTFLFNYLFKYLTFPPIVPISGSFLDQGWLTVYYPCHSLTWYCRCWLSLSRKKGRKSTIMIEKKEINLWLFQTLWS